MLRLTRQGAAPRTKSWCLWSVASFKVQCSCRCRRWCRCPQRHWGIQATWTTTWLVWLRRWFRRRDFTSWWLATLRWRPMHRHAVLHSYNDTAVHWHTVYVNICMVFEAGPNLYLPQGSEPRAW